MRRKLAVGCVLAFVVTLFLSPALSAQVAPDSNQVSPPNLTCSPAPCIFPNVQVDNLTWGAEPRAIVVNPNNSSQMLAAAEDGNCGSSEGFFSTSDGGATWPIHSCIETSNAVGEPIAGYDLNNVAYGGGIDDGTAIVVRSSTDSGAHWSNAKRADGDGLGTLWPWLIIDTSPTSPFRNNLYISSVHGGVYSQYTRVHVSYSSDGGQHWMGRVLDKWQSNNLDLFPHLSVGADGTLYETWVRCRNNGGPCNKTGVPVLLSKSTDGGNSWTAAAVVAKVNLVSPDNCLYGCLPNTTAAITNSPVSAVFGSGPTAKVYVVFCDWSGTQIQVKVVTSTDGGTTFGVPVRVSSSNHGDQFVPWVSLAVNGTIGVSWLDRRNDPANLKYQPFVANSADGKTFSPSLPLSSVLSDPSPFNGFVIEPGTSVWVGSAIYATWIDGRSGLPRVELGGVQF